MATTTTHVNGSALVYIATGGSFVPAGLGYGSEAGVRLTFNNYTEPWFSDRMGPYIPVEVQNFGQDCVIEVDFHQWDDTVMDLVWKRLHNASTGADVGESGNDPLHIGTLYRANVQYLRVTITKLFSGEATGPFNFPYCVLEGPRTLNVGSRASAQTLIFRALPNPTNGLLWDETVNDVV